MKLHALLPLSVVAIAATVIFAGCGSKDDHDHADGHGDGEKESGHGHGHGHGEESPSGAAFKAGKGVLITEETRQIMGLTVAELEEQKLPYEMKFEVQLFDNRGLSQDTPASRVDCNFVGSGFLPPEQAARLRTGQKIQLTGHTNQIFSGEVLGVHDLRGAAEAEVTICICGAVPSAEDGAFATATITMPREDTVPVIPKAALLRTSEGTFVYALNGEAYFRTAVKTGSEAEGKIEIIDGLLAGDAVVTHPVETLWLIELRATKGGAHCH